MESMSIDELRDLRKQFVFERTVRYMDNLWVCNKCNGALYSEIINKTPVWYKFQSPDEKEKICPECFMRKFIRTMRKDEFVVVETYVDSDRCCRNCRKIVRVAKDRVLHTVDDIPMYITLYTYHPHTSTINKVLFLCDECYESLDKPLAT